MKGVSILSLFTLLVAVITSTTAATLPINLGLSTVTGCTITGTTVSCNLDQLFTTGGSYQNDTDLTVTAGAALTGATILIRETTVVKSLAITTNIGSAPVVFSVASGATLITLNGVTSAAGTTINVAAGATAWFAYQDTGVTASSTINGALTLADSTTSNPATVSVSSNINFGTSSEINLGTNTILDLEDTTSATVSGAVNVAAGATLNVKKATITFAGSIAMDASSKLHAETSTVTFDTASSINGSLELAGSTYINSRTTAANFLSVTSTNTNNNITAAANTVANVRQNVTVSANSSITVAGSLAVRGAVFTRGLVEASSGAVVSIYGGLFVDSQTTGSGNAHVTLDGSATVTVNSTTASDVNGVLTLGTNSVFHIRSEAATTTRTASRIGMLVVVGAGAQARATGAAVINIAQNLTVYPTAAVTLYGVYNVQGVSDAEGAVTVGAAAGSTDASITTNVTFAGSVESTGTFVVNSGARAYFYSTTYLNGTVTLAANSYFHIVSAVTSVKTAVVAQGNTTVQGTLIVGDKAQSWTQQTGVFLLQSGTVIASNLVIGVATSADVSAALSGVGSIQANVQVYAAVSAGNSPGTISITGDLTFGANAVNYIELASSTSFDVVAVSGVMVRAGRLVVTTINGYQPSNNARFTVFTHTSASGSFAVSPSQYRADNQATSTAVVFTGNTNSAPSLVAFSTAAILAVVLALLF